MDGDATPEKPAISLGESRVMVVYKDDPVQHIQIDSIRKIGAEFIDLIDSFKSAKSQDVTSEQARLFALAFTTIEEAVMWSIKAITK